MMTMNAAAIDDVLGLESMDLGFIERQLVKEALALAERRETWKMHKAVLSPIVNALRKLGACISFPDSLDVTLIGDAAVLAKAVRILRTSGYSFPSASRPKKGDTTWVQFFTRSECSVRIWFNFSSSVCRRVQTGTKMVEQPVFETVCDSIELPPTDELAAAVIALTSNPVVAVDEIPF
jgi:hypothetical protein